MITNLSKFTIFSRLAQKVNELLEGKMSQDVEIVLKVPAWAEIVNSAEKIRIEGILSVLQFIEAVEEEMKKGVVHFGFWRGDDGKVVRTIAYYTSGAMSIQKHPQGLFSMEYFLVPICGALSEKPTGEITWKFMLPSWGAFVQDLVYESREALIQALLYMTTFLGFGCSHDRFLVPPSSFASVREVDILSCAVQHSACYNYLYVFLFIHIHGTSNFYRLFWTLSAEDGRIGSDVAGLWKAIVADSPQIKKFADEHHRKFPLVNMD